MPKKYLYTTSENKNIVNKIKSKNKMLLYIIANKIKSKTQY